MKSIVIASMPELYSVIPFLYPGLKFRLWPRIGSPFWLPGSAPHSLVFTLVPRSAERWRKGYRYQWLQVMEFGVAVSAHPERERINLSRLIEGNPVAPFDQAAGVSYGPIRLATRVSKKDHLDKLVAAHAVALNVTLVTNNIRGFARYPGLICENWY